MITGLTFVLAAGALFLSLAALFIASLAAGRADQAMYEHGLTLDAADDLFEDHEQRITQLELI